MFRSVIEKAMTEQGLKVPTAFSKADGFLSQSKHDDTWALSIGDQISLYMDTDSGYAFMSAGGIENYNARCNAVETASKNQLPSNFKECVFVVCNQNQYIAANAYHKKLDSIGPKVESESKQAYTPGSARTQSTTNPNVLSPSTALTALRSPSAIMLQQSRQDSIVTLSDKSSSGYSGSQLTSDNDLELQTLRLKMDKEREQNKIEAERSIGKEVLYGQGIQLLHLKTNKYLTVARESAEMQKDCMRLTLDERGNSNSIFYMMPYYKFRTEGQKVLISDQIRLWNRKSNQFVHLSQFRYKHDNRREVNMSTDVNHAKWRLRLFTRFLVSDTMRSLKAGDVIRFYHKEADGFLTIDPKNVSFTVKIKPDADEEAKHSSNTMWEVEQFDPSRGGLLKWNSMYRLKHVATNKYMTVRVPVAHDSDSEDSDDDDSTAGLSSVKSQERLDSQLSLDKDGENTPADDDEFSSPRSVDDEAIDNKLNDRDDDEDGSDGYNSPRVKKQATRSMLNLTRGRAASNLPLPTLGTSKWNILRKKILKDKSFADIAQSSDAMKRYELFVDDPSATSTLFTIHPPNKTKGEIPVDSFIRLRHNQTASWFHAITDSANGARSALKRSETSKNLLQEANAKKKKIGHVKIETRAVMNEEDVFVVKPVSQQQIDDLLFIQSVIPVLDNVIAKFTHQRSLKKTEMHSVTGALDQLILFCTESGESDPMLREGIPNTVRQNYLREQKVVDRVMEILRLPFENGYLKPEEIHDEKFFAYKELLKHAYRLIKQSCKLNNANGLYMSPYIGFIQTQIEYGIGVSAALTEILSNNYDLLNKITEEEIKFFINLLLTSNKNSDYLVFLSALCDVYGNPVPKNQDFIIQMLFNDQVDVKKSLMVPFMSPDEDVMVMIDDKEVELKNFSLSAMSKPNAKYSTRKFNRDQIEFFQNTIELLGKLCMGRNTKCISTISSLISFDMIMRCMEDETLPDQLRSNFCHLMLHCYIDTAPYEKKPLVILTRNWTPQMGTSAQEKRKQVKKNQGIAEKMKELKSFLDFYYSNHHGFVKQSVEANKLILTLTRICKTLFEFGIYGEMDEIGPIINKLFRMLDGKNDHKLDGKALSDSERYVLDEENMVVCNIKIEICRIFNIMLDIAHNRRLSYFMEAFKHRVENDNPYEDDVIQDRKDEDILTKLFAYNEKNEKPSTILDSPEFKRNFYAVMQDLMNYENQDLANSAMNLLFRLHHQKEELCELLPKVELLVSRQMIRSYNDLNKGTSKLRQLLAGESSSRLRGQEAIRVRDLMENMVKDVRQNGQRSQRILRNLQVHEISLSVLNRSFNDPQTQTLLWRWATRLLTEFVRNNPENQRIIFRHLEFLISRLGIISDTCILLCEVVKNNRALCSTIEEKHVRSFIDAIAENGLQARYLMFLRSIVSMNGKPLKRNQTIVTKNLMERKKDVLKLFNDEEGLRERHRRIMNNEHITKPDGILNYHISLLQLLCDCADGKNHVAEVKLQALLSIDVILEQLNSSMLIPQLRDPLVRFLDEVYVNTEKESIKLQTGKLWTLFERLNKELLFFIEGPKISKKTIRERNQSILENYRKSRKLSIETLKLTEEQISLEDDHSSLKDKLKLNLTAVSSEPAPSTSTSTVIEDEMLIDNHYVYKLMIPLIHHYFHKHYPPPSITDQQEKVTQQLIFNLTNLYSKTANPNQREALKKCIQAMYKKRLNVKGSAKTHIDTFLQKLYADTSKPVEVFRGTPHRLEEKDEQICNQYGAYIKLLRPKLLAKSDMKNVAKLYSQQKDLNTLVKVLRQINFIGYNEETTFATVRALRTLQTVMKNVIEMDDEIEDITLKQNQLRILNQMVVAQAPALVLELVCCDVNIIVKEALQLGILLLVDGNKIVQGNVYQIFTQTNSETFFVAIRDRIRLAIREIKNRRDFMKKRMQKLNALSESNRVINLGELRNRDVNNIKGMQQQLAIAQNHSKMKSIELTDQNSRTVEVDVDRFVEHGYINKILRFLQLMCEGHNGFLQEYLNTQVYNNLSVNLVQECLQYILALEKYIDSNTIHIVIQAFDTLTEFIQGPCTDNQQSLGLSPKLYFTSNEILQSEQLEASLPLLDVLKLRYKVILTLISLTEGNRDENLYQLMRNSLNSNILQSIFLKCARVRTGVDDSELLQRAKTDFNNIQQNSEEECPPPDVLLVKIKKYYEKLGLHIYFLLNIFSDQNSADEKADERLRLWFADPANKKALEGFQQVTGRIEILRNNFIERVYFRKPDISNNMIEQTKKEFLYSCDRETAQKKVQELFQETNKFRIEMEHYEKFRLKRAKGKQQQQYDLAQRVKASAWNFVEMNWSRIKQFAFFYTILLNIIVCCTYKKTYDPLFGSIPVPGFSEKSNLSMQGSYSVEGIEVLMFVLGLIQLVITLSVFALYMYFYAKLKVKKMFSADKTTKWEKREFNLEFVLAYIIFSLQDTQIWFFVVWFGISLIGFAVTPLAYCLLLFEVINRAPTLKTILVAIQNNVRSLVLTSVLMLFTIFFFTVLYFTYRADDFVLNGGEDRFCDTAIQCFVGMINYGIRGGGFWEDLMNPTLDPLRFVIDMCFFVVVITIMINIVFGIILDSFAELRQERETLERLVKDRCFICDIEKSRFDMKANENIRFEDHIKNDHYMWNYVFFLIYLYKKKRTEYTGVEQYIFNLADENDPAFFPILRSLTLEQSDAKSRTRLGIKEDDEEEQDNLPEEVEQSGSGEAKSSSGGSSTPTTPIERGLSSSSLFNVSMNSMKQ